MIRGVLTARHDIDLAVKFRAARIKCGISQSMVARRAGVDVKTVARTEAGTSVPRLETLAALASAVEIDMSELIGPEG